MKKRILSLVLALSMMISLFPVSALAQTPGGGTAEMAEENGETEETAGTITIDSSGEPVISGLHTDSEGYWVGNGWTWHTDLNEWYMESCQTERGKMLCCD